MTIPIGTRVRLRTLRDDVRDPGAPAPLTGIVYGHDDRMWCLVRLNRVIFHEFSPGAYAAETHVCGPAEALDVLPEEATA